nr:restriction endonuclease subunit S [Nocardia carnea]
MTVQLRRAVLDSCDGPFGSAIKSEHYVDSGARVIRLGNIGTGFWKDSDEAYLPLEYWRSLAGHHAESGDVVVAGLGDENNRVGRACVVPDIGPALVKADCYRFRVDPNLLDPRYLAAYLSSEAGLAEMRGLADGSTRLRLTLGKALSVRIPLLPLEEQRRIADFLDAETSRIDRILILRKRSIALLGERIATVIDSLVRGQRYAQRVPTDFLPLGHVPESWVVARLRSLRCQVQTGPFGSQLHAEDYVDNGWPVVNPANITPQGIVGDTAVTVSDEVRARLTRHILEEGDVVFGRRGELGRAAVVTSEQAGWICGTGSLRVRLNSGEFHPGYLMRYLGIPALRHYFLEQSVGSTMANLNSSILLRMPLLLPGFAEQEEISRECDSAERAIRYQIGLIEKQSSILAERRQALITAAVTGQFDVSTASGRNITQGV